MCVLSRVPRAASPSSPDTFFFLSHSLVNSHETLETKSIKDKSFSWQPDKLKVGGASPRSLAPLHAALGARRELM